MKSLNRQKILLGFLGLVIVVAIIYYTNLWRSTSLGEILATPEEEGVVGEDVLILVNKLRQVSIDTTIFDDTLFTSLQDLSIPVNPENQARFNPFAPIGSDTAGVIKAWSRTSTTNQ